MLSVILHPSQDNIKAKIAMLLVIWFTYQIKIQQ